MSLTIGKYWTLCIRTNDILTFHCSDTGRRLVQFLVWFYCKVYATPSFIFVTYKVQPSGIRTTLFLFGCQLQLFTIEGYASPKNTSVAEQGLLDHQPSITPKEGYRNNWADIHRNMRNYCMLVYVSANIIL